MFRVYLKQGIRFKIDNSNYMVLKVLTNGNIQVEDEIFGDTKIFTRSELTNLLCNNRLKFEVKGKNVVGDDSLKVEYDFEDIENNKYKELAMFRLEVIKPLLQIPSGRRKRSDIESRANNINDICKNYNINYSSKVSASSIYRWLSDYIESDGDIRSLIPSYHYCGAKSEPKLSNIIIDFIGETIKECYKRQQRITMKEAYYIVIDKIIEHNKYSLEKLENPSYTTFTRYIAKVPEYELVAARVGKRTAEQKYRLLGQGVKVSYPLERVEIDSTKLDLIIMSEDGEIIGRPDITIAIDKFSRHTLGFSLGFGGVGWPEVMQCIRHIMTDKSYVKEKYTSIVNEWNSFGVPKTIVVDNGLGYKNNPMKDACYQLGFVLEFCPPRTPEWKGSIERFFRTINMGLIHNMPGTTRSNPQQLGDDENPADYACLKFSLFLELFHKWLIDVYSQDLNKGAGGIPSKIWEKAILEYPVAWPNNTTELAVLLGRIEYRLIRNKGIELKGLYYNSIELNNILTKFSLENDGKNQKFKVKYDPNNLIEVYVYDHLIGKRWVRVPSVCPEYTNNLSEWEHEQIRAYARVTYQQVDIEALAMAKAYIRKRIEESNGYNKQQTARARKLSSDNAIFGDTYSNLHDETDKYKLSNELTSNSQDYINTSNVSDIGVSVIPMSSGDSVVPRIEIVEKDDKIINFNKKNRQNKKVKERQDNNENKENNQNEYVDFDNYSGVGILAEPKGEE